MGCIRRIAQPKDGFQSRSETETRVGASKGVLDTGAGLLLAKRGSVLAQLKWGEKDDHTGKQDKVDNMSLSKEARAST